MNYETDLLRWFSEEGEAISPRMAIELWGNTRLASTVESLREKGHRIVTEMVPAVNRHGRPYRYGRYHYAGPPA